MTKHFYVMAENNGIGNCTVCGSDDASDPQHYTPKEEINIIYGKISPSQYHRHTQWQENIRPFIGRIRKEYEKERSEVNLDPDAYMSGRFQVIDEPSERNTMHDSESGFKTAYQLEKELQAERYAEEKAKATNQQAIDKLARKPATFIGKLYKTQAAMSDPDVTSILNLSYMIVAGIGVTLGFIIGRIF